LICTLQLVFGIFKPVFVFVCAHSVYKVLFERFVDVFEPQNHIAIFPGSGNHTSGGLFVDCDVQMYVSKTDISRKKHKISRNNQNRQNTLKIISTTDELSGL